MSTIDIRELDHLFDGERLFLLGDFSGGLAEGNDLKDSFVLALDFAITLFPSATFWCLDNFQKDWPQLDPLVDSPETRIFTANKMSGERNWVLYTPNPLWALPPSDVEKWKASEKGNECPIGWGSLCLGLGIAYRLGFNEIEARGCLPGASGSRWDPQSQNFRPVSESVRGQFKMGLETANKLSSLLELKVNYKMREN